MPIFRQYNLRRRKGPCCHKVSSRRASPRHRKVFVTAQAPRVREDHCGGKGLLRQLTIDNWQSTFHN